MVILFRKHTRYMNQPNLNQIVDVNHDLYRKYLNIYSLWKQLNRNLLDINARKANFPTEVSEGVIAYNYDNFTLLKNANADIFDYDKQHYIEVKTTSNFDRDLSSFSPNANFDNLYFGRLDFYTDNLYVYNLKSSIEAIKTVAVNGAQSFAAQQNQQRRPRFSVINQIVEPNNLREEIIIDMITGNIINMGTGGHNVPLIVAKHGIRKLTPTETFNVQGFPESFILPDQANSHLYKQAGNSVVVPVIRRIAENIGKAVSTKKNTISIF